MPLGPAAARPQLAPSIGIVLGGALWGLFWLPLRELGQIGLAGAWPGAMVYLGSAVVMLPVAAWRWRGLRAHGRGLAVCGLLTGTAFATYATSLFMTEVVRVILLFYLTPVWGTLLGCLFLGERLGPARLAALALGIGGLLVVLGTGDGLPWPRNAGDWLALGSGGAWAWGSMELYRRPAIPLAEQITAFVVGSLAVSFGAIAIAAVLPGAPDLGPAPSVATLGAALPAGVAMGLYVVPMLVLTLWPATVLTPGRVGILLMSDVLVGVASAAMLSGEPFGLREALGTVLIVSAAAVEVLGRGRAA